MEVQETQVVEEFIVPLPLSPRAQNEESEPQVIKEIVLPCSPRRYDPEPQHEQPPENQESESTEEFPRDKRLVFDGRIIWRKTDEMDAEEGDWDQEVEITTSEITSEAEEFMLQREENKNAGCNVTSYVNPYEILKDLPIVEISPDGFVIHGEEVVTTDKAVNKENGNNVPVEYMDHDFDNGSEDDFNDDDHAGIKERMIGLLSCFCCRQQFRSFSEIRNHARELSEARIKGNNIPVWRKHICCLCGYTTDRLWSLKTHVVSVHEGKKDYACPHCNYNTSIFSDLRIHLQSHKAERPYACPECEYRAVTSGSLKSHINLRHSKDRTHPCQQCEFVAPSTALIKAHISAVHRTETSYQCGLCDYKSRLWGSWKNHILSVHAKVKPFKCSECPYQTNKAELLNAHINRKHNKEQVLLHCPQCPYTVSRPSFLETHIQDKHNIPEYECVYCEYKTLKPDNLRRHIENKHLPEDIPECPFCGLRAVSLGAMKRHIKTFHVKKTYFVCSYCTFSASLATDLELHVQQTHQQEKKSNRCNQCMFSSDTASELTEHIVSTHLRPSRGQCPFCEYRDEDSEALAEHIRSAHAKQKTYRCPHCDFGCTTPDIMKKHAQSQHNVRIVPYIQ